MEPKDWQTVPRLQGRVHRTSILRQPVVPVIARWLATGWRLTQSVARPQGWTAWRVDTRQQKDLAARRGADVGSWTEALPGRKVGWRGRPTPANRKTWPQGKVWTLAVDRKRHPAARLDSVEGRHPPTEGPGRKARCGRWQLDGSVARPQGWMAWKTDTRRQKDLAARQGVDVGSWSSVLPTARWAHVRRLAGSVSEPTHGWWCYWRCFAVRRPWTVASDPQQGWQRAACPCCCPRRYRMVSRPQGRVVQEVTSARGVLTLSWNCSVCAGRVQNYGAALRGQSSIRYRTASRSSVGFCPSFVPGVLPTVGPQGLAHGGTMTGACLLAGMGRELRLSPAPYAFRTCPEATQWKVLVTFLSIWPC